MTSSPTLPPPPPRPPQPPLPPAPQFPQLPPPGWYYDPSGQAWLRWWDGRTWTPHTSGPAYVAPVDRSLVEVSGRPFHLAGWWRRAGGLLLDGLVLVVPGFGVQFLIGSFLYSQALAFGFFAHRPTADPLARSILFTVQVAVALAYAGIMLGYRGQTVGMMVAGVRAIDLGGGGPMARSQVWCRVIVSFLLAGFVNQILFYGAVSRSSSSGTPPWVPVLVLVEIALGALTYLWPLGSARRQTWADKAAGSIVVLKER